MFGLTIFCLRLQLCNNAFFIYTAAVIISLVFSLRTEIIAFIVVFS